MPLTPALGLVRPIPSSDQEEPFTLLATLRAISLMVCCAAPVQAAEITVFAAASLGDALADAAEAWEAESGHGVTLVLAGSSTLARQIEAGAPADVFVSANRDWMDWLSDNRRIDPETRTDIASNRLVLIAFDPELHAITPITTDTDLLNLLGDDGRLSIALPDAVPAGIYAKSALSNLGLWESVADRLTPADNARAALAFVALGEAPLGVVYATDAQAEPNVTIAGVFPPETHPAITYPAAVVADSAEQTVSAAFIQWLASAQGEALLASHGFLPPEDAR